MCTDLFVDASLSGKLFYLVLSHLASLGYYEEIEKWTFPILERDPHPSSKKKLLETIGIGRLYNLRVYAALYGGHLKDHLNYCISEYLCAAPLQSATDAGTFVRTSTPTRVQLEQWLLILFSLRATRLYSFTFTRVTSI